MTAHLKIYLSSNVETRFISNIFRTILLNSHGVLIQFTTVINCVVLKML